VSSPRGLCGGQSDTGTDVGHGTAVLLVGIVPQKLQTGISFINRLMCGEIPGVYCIMRLRYKACAMGSAKCSFFFRL